MSQPSRREFLIVGGTVLTGLSLGDAPIPERPCRQSESRVKIRKIMERYGSEFGNAQFES
jgi:hypothetical protein